MSVKTLSSIEERVDAGASWLDSHEPGWWQEGRIDTLTLNLSDCELCVGGQLSGTDFADFIAAQMDHPGWRFDVPALGFDVTEFCECDRECICGEDEYAVLTEAWRELVLARRATTAESDASVDTLLEAL